MDEIGVIEAASLLAGQQEGDGVRLVHRLLQ